MELKDYTVTTQYQAPNSVIEKRIYQGGYITFLWRDRIDQKEAKTISIKPSKENPPIPLTTRTDNYHLVDDLVDGVIFVGSEGLTIVIRRELEVKTHYFVYSDSDLLERRDQFPAYPIVLEKRAKYSRDKKAYFQLLKAQERALDKYYHYLHTEATQTIDLIKKFLCFYPKERKDIHQDLRELTLASSRDQVRRNLELRDQIHREVYTLESVARINHLISQIGIETRHQLEALRKQKEVIGKLWNL